MKRVMVAVIASAALWVAVAPPASAHIQPCPPGFILVGSSTAPQDRNNNFEICLRVTPAGGLVTIDDHTHN